MRLVLVHDIAAMYFPHNSAQQLIEEMLLGGISVKQKRYKTIMEFWEQGKYYLSTFYLLVFEGAMSPF